MSVFQKLLALMLLKSGPQDLPYSQQLTVLLATAYIVSGIIVLNTTINPDDLISGVFLGFAVQYVFTWSVLKALNKLARFVQTFSAMLGVGIVFNVLSWPVFSVLTSGPVSTDLQSYMSLAFLLIISWEVLVKAHIFRHALEMNMLAALVLSFSLFFISIVLSQLLFPVEGVAP